MSSRKCHKDIYTLYTWGKWNPVNKDHLQKAKLDEVLAAYCRADLLTECMKKKEKNINIIRWLSFSFFSRKWMSIFVFVSFSAVNGISFCRHFRLRPKLTNAFRSASSIQHKNVLVLVLRCKVLVLVLNNRLGPDLGLGLERILKSWSWSWN